MDLSEMSTTNKVILGVGALAVVAVLFFVISAVFFGPKQDAVVKVPPPPGYPDVAPYNTKSWQDMQKKTASQGQMAPMPPGPPGMR
ncbi:MAG: hypothetical protein SFU56_06555 [Capsulimonadales bacterium]|nr:hypothetical protein [Capsulimonadales bacterium]